MQKWKKIYENNIVYSVLYNMSDFIQTNVLHFIYISLWICLLMVSTHVVNGNWNKEQTILFIMFGWQRNLFFVFFFANEIVDWNVNMSFSCRLHGSALEFIKSKCIYNHPILINHLWKIVYLDEGKFVFSLGIALNTVVYISILHYAIFHDGLLFLFRLSVYRYILPHSSP